MSKRTNHQPSKGPAPVIGGLDLQTLRGDKDVVAGFGPSVGLYRFEVENAAGEKMHAEMPVLDINYQTADGRQHRMSIPPDSTMALIAILSEFSIKMQQGAPPPAPPVSGDRP